MIFGGIIGELEVLFKEVVDGMYIITSFMKCLSFCRWSFAMTLSFNFNSTLYCFNNQSRLLSQRLLMWCMMK